MGSSTKRGSARTRGFWPIEEFPVALLGEARKCSADEARAYLARTSKEQTDPRWVDAMLERISVPALAVLSVLAEHGRFTSHHELSDSTKERFGLDDLETMAGAYELIGHALIAPLAAGYSQGYGLVWPAAELVTERVAALDVAPLGDAPFVPNPDADGGRMMLAVCAVLGQLELKATRDGRPHRGGSKRIAKQVALDEDKFEALVLLGLHAGILIETEDAVLRPDRDALIAAARGGFPHHAGLDGLARTLREGGVPVCAGAIDRWEHLAVLAGHRAVSPSMLEKFPGFTVGSVGGEPAFMTQALLAAPMVTVTPSFEVFLPPETPLADVVTVLGMCEPTRLDRVIVARLTRSSVARAADGTRGDLVELLSTACKTPLPQNVVASMRDWLASVTVATVAQGRVVVVQPTDEARTAAALATFAPRVLAPGVLLVATSVTPRALSTALGKIGVKVDGADSIPSPVKGRRERDAKPPPLPVAARPGLAARVVAYRNGDASERARVVRMERVTKVAPASPSSRVRQAPVSDDHEHDPAVERAILTWESRVRDTLDQETYCVVASQLERLSDFEQRFALNARTADELLARLEKLAQRDAREQHAALAASSARNGVTSTPAGYVWIRDGLHAHLEAAARTHARYVLDLGDRSVEMHVSAVMMRGKTLMVLGEDDDDRSVAVRFAAIRGVAEPVTDSARRSRPWSPAEGETAPPGHLPCPCGSGERYRACCRAAADQPS